MGDSDALAGEVANVETKDSADTYVMDVRRDPAWNTLEGLFGLTRSYGFSIADAVRQACFMICADVIAQDISKAPLRMKEKLSPQKNQIVEAETHPVAFFISDEPNIYHTWDEFWELQVRNIAMFNNAYTALDINNRGDIRNFFPISLPLNVSIQVDPETGMLFYATARRNNFEMAMLKNFPMMIPGTEMMHFRTRLMDGLYGFSTLDAGSDVLARTKAVGDYQQRLYDDDARNKGVFEIPQEMSDKAYQRLRDQLARLWKSHLERNIPMILEGGTKFSATTMSAKDAEVAAVYKAQMQDVCRLFRMPPHKAMLLDAVKYENLDTMEQMYVSDTLIPIAKRIEGVMKKTLLMQKERGRFFFEFDRIEMAATDFKTRAELAVRGVQAGLLEVDEGRRLGYGLDPLENDQGKTRIIAANMQVVDEKGEVVITASSGGAAGPDNGANGAGDMQNNGSQGKKDAKILQLVAKG